MINMSKAWIDLDSRHHTCVRIDMDNAHASETKNIPKHAQRKRKISPETYKNKKVDS